MQLWSRDAEPNKYGPNLPSHESHMVELGFAFTFFKVQGATLSCVLLDLNFESAMERKAAAVYVGLSRVKHSDDMRILPFPTEAAREKVEAVTFNEDLLFWQEVANKAHVVQQEERRRAEVARADQVAVVAAVALDQHHRAVARDAAAAAAAQPFNPDVLLGKRAVAVAAAAARQVPPPAQRH